MEDSFTIVVRGILLYQSMKSILYHCEETIFIVKGQHHCFTMKFL